MARSKGRRRKPRRSRGPVRIAAYAAVPLVLAGGVAAVRAWEPGGATAGAASPSAMTSYDIPSSAAPAASGDGTAEAASDEATPRVVPQASNPSGRTGETEDKRPDPEPAKKPAAKKSETKKADDESASEQSPGEHPGGGVLRPGGDGYGDAVPEVATDGAGTPGAVGPDGGASASGEPGAKSPGKAVPGYSKHTDGQALGYFMWRWGPQDAAIKKITDIRTLGGYLRIYTKMPDTAVNSRHAVKLCERGREFLSKERNVRHPVVFVHAKTGLNGNPVLANDLGARDKDCRLTTPRPG